VTRGPIRVLIAKPGLDGHDRGAGVVARALRDAGMEVIYTGIRQTPEMIVAVALQEDVDCVGLSVLSGSHVEYARDVRRMLVENGAEDLPLVLGGIVPDDDLDELREIGVGAVFTPGAPLRDITRTIEALATEGSVGTDGQWISAT
jgi:methylmalonyl-CoA mutase C-terminal domain/subunit